MKKIFTISALAFSMLLFSQEAGKAGELLKNEASKSEMQTRKKETTENRTAGNRGNNGGILDNSGYRNGNRGNTPKNPKSYQWNNSYGYSEVFLRIPERGYYTVEVGDQMMSNASGKYRFFDLNAGRIPIAIYENGFLVYRTQLNMRNNSRMILDFFSDYGLYLLDTVPVQNYGFNNWDDVWNNPYGNSGWNNGYGNSYYGNVMDERNFSSYMNSLSRLSFDKERTSFVNSTLRNSQFTSKQIKSIISQFSFDDAKLAVAKSLYRNCVDRNNFYVVYDEFSFDRHRRDLMSYVANT